MLDTILADFIDPFPALAWQTAFVRLMAAILLTGLIGWERETRDKSAGLRTHMMVGLASCLFALLSFEIIELQTDQADRLQLDPLRLIEAVTAGVAFLAAGSILQSGGKVRGLTTGAGMWMSGAIGLSCGLGQVVLAGLAVAVGMLVLGVLRLVTH